MLNRLDTLRILFDQNTPDPLSEFLTDHEVVTSESLGWATLKNGLLLQAAEVAGFDLMITCDQNLKYQQNLSKRRIALVVLGSNRWPFVQLHLLEIVAAVNEAKPKPNSYVFGEIPLPPKSEFRPYRVG